MKDSPNLKPAMIKLIDAFQQREGGFDWPIFSASPQVDILLIVTKSVSTQWERGRAYFTALEASKLKHSNMELESVEGFIFLLERQEALEKEEVISFSAAGPYIRLCEHILAFLNSEDELDRFRGHIYFQELLYELYRAREQGKYDARTAVEKTKIYIDTHYAKEMTIEGLAFMADISPSYYIELFKKIVGRSPIDYLTSVRIKAARCLLDDTKAPAYEIAQAVGYRDPFYFSRQFKRVTGVSPSRYARRSTHRIASFHYPMTGQMLALQNIPYAAPLDREFCLFYKQKYELQIPIHLRDPSLETNRDFNLETLWQARPDVIIAGDWISEADREDLNRIAPTLYVPWWEKDWREHLLIVARFLNETSQAERWLEKYDAQAAKVRSQLSNELGDVMAIHVLQGQIHRFGSRNLGTVLYDDLQLTPTGQEYVEKVYELITTEQLLNLNPSRLLVAVGDDRQSKELWISMNQRPEWKEMKAVRNRYVYPIQPDPWFDYSAMGNERILKEVFKLFSSDRPS